MVNLHVTKWFVNTLIPLPLPNVCLITGIEVCKFHEIDMFALKIRVIYIRIRTMSLLRTLKTFSVSVTEVNGNGSYKFHSF